MVGRILAAGEFENVVLDPVFYSSSKFPLLDDEGIEGIRRLMPYVAGRHAEPGGGLDNKLLDPLGR